jgi:SAM-dependent methyltransferase
MIDRWRIASRVFGVLPAGRLDRFGPRQLAVVGICGSVEWMRRHLLLMEALERLRQALGRPRLRVLDFGGGAGSLTKALALHALQSRYELVLCDVDPDLIALAPALPMVRGRVHMGRDGALPFRDGSFDAAVSSDVFEHIPSEGRGAWVSELDRVTRHGQAHTVPCSSGDGAFDGARADERLQQWHVTTFGRKDPFTAEHQERGLPTHDELRALFPRARLQGFANVDLWLEQVRDQILHTSAAGRLRNGWRFLRQDRAAADGPPWKNCLVDALRGPGAT